MIPVLGLIRVRGRPPLRWSAEVWSFILLALLALTALPAPSSASVLGWNADALAVDLDHAGKLPSAPAGVTEIKFTEFYQRPVGPRGLELTAKARALAGHRVRLLGFMVRQDAPSPGVAILAPYALATDEHEYGLCDDLPPAVVFVTVPAFRGEAVPYTPGPLLLTGRLEIGPHEEADGRVSQLRLVLDAEPTPAPAQTVAVSAVK
ncbi:MAG TPA: hypothetical protein VIM71_05385 [Lacunisphaera sp.]